MLSFLCISTHLLKKNTQTVGILNLGLKNRSWSTDLGRIFQRIIMSVEEKFQAALRVIKSLPADGPYQPSNETKLRFYSLFKQATDGPCKHAKPAFWDLIGRAKWDSWNKLGSMSKEEAMNQYIDQLKKIVETMSYNGDVQDFLDSIGPFYEFISLNSPELDSIKEVVERLSSSSSSNCTSDASASVSNSNSLPSSADTTPQSTPAKEPDSPDDVLSTVASVCDNTEEVAITQNKNHAHTNGHIPVQKLNQNHLSTINELTSGQIPPPSPMHRPTANGYAKRYSIEDIEREDEVLEIETDNVLSSKRGPNSPGSESDKYYSGDSEPEIDQGDESSNNLLPVITVSSVSAPEANGSQHSRPGPSTSFRKVRPKNSAPNMDHTIRTLVDHNYASDSQLLRDKVDSVTVLQGTVDRLNRDIDHVLARLRILEAAYSANPGGVQNNSVNGNSSERKKSLRELSRTTWAVIFAWPVAVHFLFKLISWWLERRRKLRARPLAIMSS